MGSDSHFCGPEPCVPLPVWSLTHTLNTGSHLTDVDNPSFGNTQSCKQPNTSWVCLKNSSEFWFLSSRGIFVLINISTGWDWQQALLVHLANWKRRWHIVTLRTRIFGKPIMNASEFTEVSASTSMIFPTPHISHSRHGLFFTRLDCQSNATPSEKDDHYLTGIRTRDLFSYLFSNSRHQYFTQYTESKNWFPCCITSIFLPTLDKPNGCLPSAQTMEMREERTYFLCCQCYTFCIVWLFFYARDLINFMLMLLGRFIYFYFFNQ
jgi:hypothetical protein